MSYKIPDDILAKIPEYFWSAVAGELVSVYTPSVFVKDEDGLCGLDYIGGTAGWHTVLKATCRKLDMDWLYAYYYNLEWYDSDWFDGEMFDLIKTEFINATPKHANEYYVWLTEKKDGPKVAYICDCEACEICPIDDSRLCYHTLDIKHAVNFKEIEPGKFIEKKKKGGG